MRQFIFFICIIATISSFFSCGKDNCITPTIQSVQFLSADSIPDTGAIIRQYNKGGSFSVLVNSYSNNKTRFAILGNLWNINFLVNNVYDYDWAITFLPSGKLYQFANFSHDNSYTKSGPYGVKDRCVNTIHYTLNGSAIAAPQNSTGSSSAGAVIQVTYSP